MVSFLVLYLSLPCTQQAYHLASRTTHADESRRSPKMAPTLDSLPPEMQVAVADQVAQQDLLAFRLVARNLCAAAEDTFLLRFFTHRRPVLAKDPVEKILNIVKDRRLCQKLKSITFVSLDIPTQGPLPHGTKMAHQWQSEQNEQHRLETQLLTSRLTVELIRRQLRPVLEIGAKIVSWVQIKQDLERIAEELSPQGAEHWRMLIEDNVGWSKGGRFAHAGVQDETFADVRQFLEDIIAQVHVGDELKVGEEQ